MNTLHWMHISDLHRGQNRTSEMWAAVRAEIHEDVKRHCGSNGALDLVVFSGDMAFKGATEEFNSVLEEVKTLWEVFDEMELSPKLFIVPGNHDLARPDKTSAFLNFAPSLRMFEDIRDDVLAGKDSAYWQELHKAFENYNTFVENLKNANIPLLADVLGLFPGDVSASFEVNGLKIGIVGLNTAWTHLSDKTGKALDISVKQLNSVVSNNLPGWTKQNNVNLLVTHHPANWLHPDAKEEFEREIYNPKYFDAHLFGHVHSNEPKIESIGAHERIHLQAASLFGLEKLADGITDRRHGYYFAKIDAEKSECDVWPRRFETKSNGVMEVTADGPLLKGDNRNFQISWKIKDIKGAPLKKA